MSGTTKQQEAYLGFEQGPIRPPSEAGSLLIRITRNCPWNRCTFCPVYKGAQFSLRPVEHVLEDIDRIHRYVQEIWQRGAQDSKLYPRDISSISDSLEFVDRTAFNSALQWASYGMRSIFLQDANSLVIKPADLRVVLGHLRSCFPWVERITSYARSHTVARIADADLQAFAAAGLNRIHIGLESGSDRVLTRMKKGVTKAGHIKAGQKIKQAGMQLTEYVMPGLGGRDLSRDHALETADCLNQIDPDFIRLRTFVPIPGTDWHQRWQDNLIGFHQSQTNVHLKNYWDRLGIKTGATVFVPLCGKSLDMLWLAEQHPVLGVELSPKAVEDFFAENGLQPTQRREGAFSVYDARGVTLYCGDFFDLQPLNIREFR